MSKRIDEATDCGNLEPADDNLLIFANDNLKLDCIYGSILDFGYRISGLVDDPAK